MPKRNLRIARAKRRIVGEKKQQSSNSSPSTLSTGPTAESSSNTRDPQQGNSGSETRIPPSSASAGPGDNVSGSSHVPEGESHEAPEDRPLRQPQSTPVETERRPAASPELHKEPEQTVTSSLTDMATHRAENQEGLQAATTKSQASSFDPLANTPMKRTEMEDDKKSGQTQEPSPGATNTSQPTATHQPQSEPSKPDESDGNIRVSLPPPSMSPGTGQQAGPSSPMTASVQHHPVFVMRDPDGARFAPFMGEDSPNSTESMTEVIIRDQIRRCEAMLGRSLTHNERETITSHYHSMGCDRGAPSETDEPTMTVRSHPHRNEVEDEPKSVDPSRPHAGDGSNTGGNHQPPLLPSPAPAPSPAAGPFHPPTQPSPGPTTTLGKRPWDPEEKDDPDPINTLPGLRGRPLDGLSEADLRQEIERLEGQLRDVARGGFTLLRFERRASEKRLGKLEAELAAVKAEVTELRARFDEAVVNMERGGGGGSRRAERDAAAAAARHRRGGGLFGFKSVMFVVAMIVWLHVGTEAMVHSKRLADGYGGYVNGGFNGLGSVLVFGTWKQFVVFEAAVVFLGVLGCGAVMG